MLAYLFVSSGACFAATACPPAPHNFTAYPGHCVGQSAPNCGAELAREECNKALNDCFADAERNCTADHRCNGFALRCNSGGDQCDCGSVKAWQTYALAAVVENSDWLSYTRLPAPPPTPSPPTPPPTPFKCTSVMDCSLNGVCAQNGTCACDDPWTGESCAKLAIDPAPSGGMYGYGAPFATTSWGKSDDNSFAANSLLVPWTNHHQVGTPFTTMPQSYGSCTSLRLQALVAVFTTGKAIAQ